MKKTIALILSLMLIISMIAACAAETGPPTTGDEPSNISADADADDQGETHQGDESGETVDTEIERADHLTIALNSGGLTAATVESAYINFFESYTALTGTVIEPLFMPGGADYRAWLTTQHAAGTTPDIFAIMLSQVWEDYATGLVVDLTDFLQEENPYNPGMPWIDTFDQSLLEQTVDPISGKFVSVMRELVAVRIIYNRDIFTSAGVTETPTTWAEFLQVCQQIQEAGYTPFAFAVQAGSGHSNWFLTSLFGQLDAPLRATMDIDGDGFVSKNELARATVEGLIDFSEDPFRTGFELFRDFSQYWNSDFNAIDMETAQQLWLMGQASMLALHSADLLAVYQMEGRDFEFGSFSFPMVTPETTPLADSGLVTMLGGAANESWAISVNAAESDAQLNSAVDLLRYLTSHYFVDMVVNELMMMPVINDVQLREELQGFIKQDFEDIRRANYTGPATLSEFSHYIIMALQLYLPGTISFEEFTESLNREWTEGMLRDMEAAGWNEENNFGIEMP